MIRLLKKAIKALISDLGYELVPKHQLEVIPVGSKGRPVGDMKCLLEDMKHRGLQCFSILDVGANQGLWSRMAKEVYPECNFNLIEPQIEHEPKLKQFCEEFKGSQYFITGAGSKNEILTLTIWDDLQGSSVIYEEKEELLTIGKQRKIDVVKIDDLIKQRKIKIPQLMKLDIQGFELEALKGATHTFGITEAYILEIALYSFGAPVINEVIDFMLQKNYVVYDFPGFIRRPLDGALYQCDICFVKKDSFLRKHRHWKDEAV